MATLSDINAAMMRRLSHAEAIGALFPAWANNDAGFRLAHRQSRVYHRAHEASKAFGFVGVGCISFAEGRVDVFNRRAARAINAAITA
jgi:hypothetical protein